MLLPHARAFVDTTLLRHAQPQVSRCRNFIAALQSLEHQSYNKNLIPISSVLSRNKGSAFDVSSRSRVWRPPQYAELLRGRSVSASSMAPPFGIAVLERTSTNFNQLGEVELAAVFPEAVPGDIQSFSWLGSTELSARRLLVRQRDALAVIENSANSSKDDSHWRARQVALPSQLGKVEEGSLIATGFDCPDAFWLDLAGTNALWRVDLNSTTATGLNTGLDDGKNVMYIADAKLVLGCDDELVGAAAAVLVVSEFVSSPCGEVLACRIFGRDGLPHAHIRASVDGGVTWLDVDLFQDEDFLPSRVVAVAKDGNSRQPSIWVQSADGLQRAAVHRYSFDNDNLIWQRKQTFASSAGHVSGVEMTASGSGPLRFRVDDDREGVQWFQVPSATRRNSEQSEYLFVPGGDDKSCRNLSHCVSLDRREYLWAASSDWSSFRLGVVGGEARVILSSACMLTADALKIRRRPVSIEARDGSWISGFLTERISDSDEQAPTEAAAVVHVHGGPATKISAELELRDAFLASRGYVVLSINFRGSTTERTWMAQGEGDLTANGLAYKDVVDSLMWLRKDKRVDSSRIGLYGESFGGYIALSLLSSDTEADLVACAATFAPVVNWEAILERSRIRSESGFAKPWEHQRLEQMVGSYLKPENMVNGQQWQPLLIGTGQRDDIVPPTDALLLTRRLKERGSDVACIQFPRSGHRFELVGDGVRWLTEVEAFFGTHLKGESRPASTFERIEQIATRLTGAGA